MKHLRITKTICIILNFWLFGYYCNSLYYIICKRLTTVLRWCLRGLHIAVRSGITHPEQPSSWLIRVRPPVVKVYSKYKLPSLERGNMSQTTFPLTIYLVLPPPYWFLCFKSTYPLSNPDMHRSIVQSLTDVLHFKFVNSFFGKILPSMWCVS